MTASPEVLAAFETWKLSELAAHYAAPCPDEVMDLLVGREAVAFDALQALPVTSPHDALLKVFPLLLRDFEPRAGEPPLRPSGAKTYSYEPEFTAKLIHDLGVASPVLRAAMAAPSRSVAA